MKYEVWAILKDEVLVKEVLIREFWGLGAASKFAYDFSVLTGYKTTVYNYINGFRHKISSYDRN